jgi:hypothetical protein
MYRTRTVSPTPQGLEQWLDNPEGHWVALIVLGVLTFIPGFYHTYIGFMAWRGYRGYSFNDLPGTEV